MTSFRSIAVSLVLAASALAASVPSAAALEASTAAVRVTGPSSVASSFPALDGRGVAIAVLDTGVDDEHETFRDAFALGVDVSQPTSTVASALGPAASPVAPAPRDLPCSNPDDTNGHGTHVAGIALGRGNATGVRRGVAPGARLVDVKVAVDFTSTSLAAGLERGLQWVLDYNAGLTACHVASVPRIGVVSVSFGSDAPGDANDTASKLVDQLADSGVVVVVAAGNCGPGATPVECPNGVGANTISSPGVAKGAITVAAVDDRGTASRDDDVIAPYSSEGPNGAELKPNVAAPGGPITSAAYSPVAGHASGWTTMNGTSMAAPHVAGIAALLLSAVPSLAPADVKSILAASAEDRGAPGWDSSWGAGYVDALAAVRLALSRVNAPPVAAFSATCDLLACAFDASASSDPNGDAFTFAWTFGDGTPARGARVSHSFGGPGSWLVTLTVTDAVGASSSVSRALALALPDAPAAAGASADASGSAGASAPQPSAVASVSPLEGPPGTRFFFDGTNSSEAGGRIASFAWDVDGDGVAEGSGPTFAWTPTREGVWLVRLLVTDESGRTALSSVTVTVDGSAASAPARADGARDAPPALTLLAPLSGEAVTSPVSVRWSASDPAGAPLVTLLLDHEKVAESRLSGASFDAAPGVHTLTVRAVNAAGVASTVTMQLVVVAEERVADALPPPAPPASGPGSASGASARPIVATPGSPLALALAAVAVAAGLRSARRQAR